MKTFYITIDILDCTSRGHINEAQARTFAKKCDLLGSTPFRVDITEDENGKPHFEFTELKEPKGEYWFGSLNGVAYQESTLTPAQLSIRARNHEIPAVYIKDDHGNLILLNDEEKAKVIEEWKNS